jgi:hypothetical protein
MNPNISLVQTQINTEGPPALAPTDGHLPPEEESRPVHTDDRLALPPPDRAKEVVRKWFTTRDDIAVDVILGTLLANQFPGPPVWLLVVGVPSGGKTTLLEPLYGRSEVYPISSLTAKTLVSGLAEEKEDEPYSLLERVENNQVLVVKDFGSIQSLPSAQKREVLAQFREIYDGHYKKSWGTGKEVDWQGKLGIIGAVTPAIDRDHLLMAVLGERFLYFRLQRPDDKQAAIRALHMTGREDEARQELAEAFAAALDEAADPSKVECPPEAEEAIAQAAIAAAKWRTPVPKDHQHNICYLPEAESPGRLVKQLVQVAKAVAALYRRNAIGPHEITLVRRLAHDSIPSLRASILGLLGSVSNGLETSVVSIHSGIPDRTLLEKLNDLELVGVVKKDATQKEAKWKAVPAWTKPLMWWVPPQYP